MILENQNELNKLDTCPLSDETKTIKLYRLCENDPINSADLIPFAISNPQQFSKICLAWGLSLHKSIEASKNALKTMSKKKQEKIKSIFSVDVDSSLALKHQSTNDMSHYTVYPYQDVDFISRFTHEKT